MCCREARYSSAHPHSKHSCNMPKGLSCVSCRSSPCSDTMWQYAAMQPVRSTGHACVCVCCLVATGVSVCLLLAVAAFACKFRPEMCICKHMSESDLERSLYEAKSLPRKAVIMPRSASRSLVAFKRRTYRIKALRTWARNLRAVSSTPFEASESTFRPHCSSETAAAG